MVLWTITAAMSALAVLTTLWATSPLEAQSHALANRIAGNIQPSTRPMQAFVDPQELAQFCQLDLRRPLHDPPPPPPVLTPPAKPSPPLNIRLSGTIVEPGHSQALIVMPDGTVQLKSVGEDAGNARIKEIGDGSITVDYLGQPTLLTVARESQN
jgi:hypothetical protein